MSEIPHTDEQQAGGDDVVTGGGTAPAAEGTIDRVGEAVARLELLSDATREAVLERMDPAIAEQIRTRMATTERPNGQFSRDVVARRKMLRDMGNRIHASNTARQSELAEQQTAQAARPTSAAHAGAGAQAAPVAPMQSGPMGGAPAPVMTHEDPLDSLRVLHPAAIARAMQGERAEAWAIVLDRLDVNARGALQAYLEPAARASIEEARARQAELRSTAPQLVDTIEAAIAKTVVPRAMREHHYLLSTNPPSWEATGTGMGASWQHA